MTDTHTTKQSGFLHRYTWTILLILIVAASKISALFLPDLNLLEDPDLEKSWIDALQKIFVSSTVLLVFRLIYRLTTDRISRIFDEHEERLFYSKIYGWLLFAIGAFIILNLFGLSLNNITLFIGIITTGLAFAVREVLLSFIGWLILLRKKPFRIGDYIRIGEDCGKVMHIGTYYVILDNTADIPDDFTRIPNRFFLEKSIEKLGKHRAHEKVQLRLSKVPENKSELIESLKLKMNKIDENFVLVSANLDIDHDKLYLIFNVLVPFEAKSNSRAKVVELILQEFGDFAYFPKD